MFMTWEGKYSFNNNRSALSQPETEKVKYEGRRTPEQPPFQFLSGSISGVCCESYLVTASKMYADITEQRLLWEATSYQRLVGTWFKF